MQKTRKISETKVLNLFTSNLPGDKLTTRVPRQVRGATYSFTEIDSFPNVSLVSLSESVLIDLHMERPSASEIEDIFKNPSNNIRNSGQSYAMCYAGHQFGNWAGQLGDGRATTFGEIQTLSGELIDIQVKGGGLTPYSRFADGKAVLRSSIREFLASEAMHALGIGTTRALAVLESGEQIGRDKVYNGNLKNEPGALCIRTSPSFVRFGNFEMMSAQNQELAQNLLEFEIKRNFKDVLRTVMERTGDESVKNICLDSNDRFTDPKLTEFIVKHRTAIYTETLKEVCQRTADMVSGWDCVGFVHGVMNTDNMSILGLTIDYGPYGFMDFFENKYTPNMSDHPGRRYAYQNQSSICVWNLSKLLSCFMGSIGDSEILMSILKEGFIDKYNEFRRQKFCLKLGLSLGDMKEDLEFVEKMIKMLDTVELDFTRFFVSLEDCVSYSSSEVLDNLENDFFQKVSQYIFIQCFDFREKNVSLDQELQCEKSVQIKEWKSGVSVKQHVMSEETTKFIENSLKESEHYLNKILSFVKEYFSILHSREIADEIRKERMRSVNPYYILRNFTLEEAIEAAEKGNYDLVNKFLEIVKNPFKKHEEGGLLDRRRPSQVEGKFGAMFLSCSS
jgi:uncharacterized protein YdiU (UPF0061 family)